MKLNRQLVKRLRRLKLRDQINNDPGFELFLKKHFKTLSMDELRRLSRGLHVGGEVSENINRKLNDLYEAAKAGEQI